MSEEEKCHEWIDSVMEQAQVFASAWSLVGSPFDAGYALETADAEKASLRAMLESAWNLRLAAIREGLGKAQGGAVAWMWVDAISGVDRVSVEKPKHVHLPGTEFPLYATPPAYSAQVLVDALEKMRSDRSLWVAPKAGGQDRYASMPPAIRLIDDALAAHKSEVKG